MPDNETYRIVVTRFTQDPYGSGEQYESFVRGEFKHADLDEVRAEVKRVEEMERMSMEASQRVARARGAKALPIEYLINRFDISVEKTTINWIPVEI